MDLAFASLILLQSPSQQWQSTSADSGEKCLSMLLVPLMTGQDVYRISIVFAAFFFTFTAALKKMKRQKAPGFSGLVAEMILATATGVIGTRRILDLCNGIVK